MPKTNRETFVHDCPEYLYTTSPDGTTRDRRYIFKAYTAYAAKDGSALDKAYAYAVKLWELELIKKAKEQLSYQHGIPAISDIRDISAVYGPDVYDRNYRITFEDERVSDYHVMWDNDFTEVMSAEEYNVVI